MEDLSNYTLTRTKQRRKIRLPLWYAQNNYVSYALNSIDDTDCDEPKSYEEVMNCINSFDWKRAMKEELDSLYRNHK